MDRNNRTDHTSVRHVLDRPHQETRQTSCVSCKSAVMDDPLRWLSSAERRDDSNNELNHLIRCAPKIVALALA